jgi:sulfur-carrier protein
MIRVVLPVHLRTLAKTGRMVEIEVSGDVTINAVLDALEENFPMLRGTIRDYGTKQRRPFIRFFACGQDFSLEPTDMKLPETVASGQDEFMVVGAMAGG